MDLVSHGMGWWQGRLRLTAAGTSGAICALLAACAGAPAGAASSTGAPPITVLTAGANNGNGDIFLAPESNGSYASGPEIVSNTGKVIWFHALPAGEQATDFRTQTYLGQPVLTWIQSGNNGTTDVIYSPSGRLLFNAKLPDGVATYRAYRLPWHPAS
jgi:hypothetical protein